jgi:hypothetical protein
MLELLIATASLAAIALIWMLSRREPPAPPDLSWRLRQERAREERDKS